MDLSALGATTAGVWTAAQARHCGLTSDQVRAKVRSGEWQVVRRGLYTDGGVRPDVRMRAAAAVLAAGGPGRALAAGRTAARLHRLPLVDDHDPLLPLEQREHRHDDVAVDRFGRAHPHLHRARLVVAPPDRALVHGVPALGVLRTLVDLTRVVTPAALVVALDDALHRRLVAPDELLAAAAARRGQAGAVAFRRAVSLADGRAESPLETLTRLLLQPVLPRLVPQVRVLDRTGRVVARLDLGDEVRRFAVESDGARWHRGEAALAADRARERVLLAHGWAVERVTWTDVRRDPEQTVRRVLAAAAARAA